MLIVYVIIFSLEIILVCTELTKQVLCMLVSEVRDLSEIT